MWFGQEIKCNSSVLAESATSAGNCSRSTPATPYRTPAISLTQAPLCVKFQANTCTDDIINPNILCLMLLVNYRLFKKMEILFQLSTHAGKDSEKFILYVRICIVLSLIYFRCTVEKVQLATYRQAFSRPITKKTSFLENRYYFHHAIFFDLIDSNRNIEL